MIKSVKAIMSTAIAIATAFTFFACAEPSNDPKDFIDPVKYDEKLVPELKYISDANITAESPDYFIIKSDTDEHGWLMGYDYNDCLKTSFHDKLAEQNFFALPFDYEKYAPDSIYPPFNAPTAIFFINSADDIPVLKYSYSVIDDSLGVFHSQTNAPDGLAAYSLDMSVFLKPISNYSPQKNFSFEFGLHKENSSERKFINIYYDTECFATVYIAPYVAIPQAWYENFFIENLIWGERYENT